MNDPLGMLRNAQIVRDHHDGIPHGIEFTEQFEHLLAGRAIQRAGGLVGQKKLWGSHQRAGNRGTLLLAARKLVWLMPHPVVHPQHVQLLHRKLFRVFSGNAANQQGHHGVEQNRVLLNQVVFLKNKSDFLVAQSGKLSVVELADRAPCQAIFPLLKAVHAADHIHQCAFSGTGRAKNRQVIPVHDLQRDILEYPQLTFPLMIALAQVFNFYDWLQTVTPGCMLFGEHPNRGNGLRAVAPGFFCDLQNHSDRDAGIVFAGTGSTRGLRGAPLLCTGGGLPALRRAALCGHTAAVPRVAAISAGHPAALRHSPAHAGTGKCEPDWNQNCFGFTRKSDRNLSAGSLFSRSGL